MIRAVLLDDEQHSRQVLCEMLTEHFKNIEVLAVCENIAEAVTAITQHHPDLVITDIELDSSSVFDMLQGLPGIDFEVIFTTAHEKYALQAIKFSALDYLLKPFSLEDLSRAIDQCQTKLNERQSARQFEVLFHNLKKDTKKIVVPTSNGLQVVSLKDIIRCQAEGNYTLFFFALDKKMLVTKTLKEFEDLLNGYDFIRVHNSHLINLNHIVKYTKGEGGVVAMSDGSEVDVSRRKKEEFLQRLAKL
ncbi:MAG: response regulator transcription factor [Bacteroidetes bacterium]|nr:response regulator transcription factor [Bacteroidota bacterium]